MRRKIEIKPDMRNRDTDSYNLYRGWREVWVDGKLWGRIECRGHGCHGTTHELRQVRFDGDSGYVIEDPKRYVSRNTYAKYKEWSNKVYTRNIDPGLPPLSLSDRILIMVERAIKAGDLRNPAILADETKNANAQIAERRAQEEHNLEVRKSLRAAQLLIALEVEYSPAANNAVLDLIQWAKENA